MKNGLILILITIVFLMSCGRGQSDISNTKTEPQRQLTEAEKAYLSTPTIYFLPTYTAVSSNACDESEKLNLMDRTGAVLFRVCKFVYRNCQLNGSCRIERNQKYHVVEVDRVDANNIRRFRITTSIHCIYGTGARSDGRNKFSEMCLDPFYSVAADWKHYSLGDVIYLPTLIGLALPDGSLHTGYVIVRDTGGNIKGLGRFDFFTGFLPVNKNKNPFVRIGLSGGGNFFPDYQLVNGTLADAIRRERGFPLLPEVN